MNQSKFSIQKVDWGNHYETLIALRREVFIQEQNVSEAEELDGRDPDYFHILCTRNSDGLAVGCARISNQGKIGRVAVLRPFRSQGVGSLIMHYCADFIINKGNTPYLDAQLDAIPFYQRLGYQAQGEVFMDANIPHKRMTLLKPV